MMAIKISVLVLLCAAVAYSLDVERLAQNLIDQLAERKGLEEDSLPDLSVKINERFGDIYFEGMAHLKEGRVFGLSSAKLYKTSEVTTNKNGSTTVFAYVEHPELLASYEHADIVFPQISIKHNFIQNFYGFQTKVILKVDKNGAVTLENVIPESPGSYFTFVSQEYGLLSNKYAPAIFRVTFQIATEAFKAFGSVLREVVADLPKQE